MPAGSRLTLEGYDWLRDLTLNEEGQRRIAKVRKLAPLAKELGCSMAQLALAWCLKNPHVSTVITGASRAEQVTENMKSLDVTSKLTADVLERIEAILENRPQPERDWRG